MPNYAIETINLTKQFPLNRSYQDLLLHPFKQPHITSLSNVNLIINQGEVFGLIGRNGAGKTTFLKILCTLVLPTSGTALVNGLEVTKAINSDRIKRLIGYVITDERSFYWRLTGRQNLRFFSILNNIHRNEREGRIEFLLNFMDLKEEADRPFKDYSTGMRKKLAILRSLLTDPEIILMDEPSNGLDPPATENLHQFIKTLAKQGKTIVLATHNLNEIETLCDRIGLLNQGKATLINRIDEINWTNLSQK